MANNRRLQFRYLGYGKCGKEKRFLVLEIEDNEYHALDNFLAMVAENNENYRQIVDAVSLRISLQEARNKMLEEIEKKENE